MRVDQIDGLMAGQQVSQFEGVESPSRVIAMAKQKWRSSAVFGTCHELRGCGHFAHNQSDKLANRVSRSEGRGRYSPAGDSLDFTRHLNGQERVSARFEEVIVNADVGAAEQSLPNFQNLRLKRSSRRDN